MTINLAKPAIMASWTVYDVLRYYPTTVLVFNDLGIDTCCGGMATIEDAARDAAVTPGDLITALESSLKQDAGGESVSWADRLLRRDR
jgi:iron-sulfur cluster repair protein YtfE (RIC family)